MTLHQVKALMLELLLLLLSLPKIVVSLEQILNTFTKFYLKDVTRADSGPIHLSPVVGTQQIFH